MEAPGGGLPQKSSTKPLALNMKAPKKSPFQLHKEAEEAKKKRLDDEAAAAYEEFVASFDAGPSNAPQAFVRGGLVEAGSSADAAPSAAAGRLGTKYVPSFIPPSMLAAKARAEEKPASVFEGRPSDKSKPRAIEAVKEELQRERELRRITGFDVAEEVPRSGGSYDTGDPSTTNLYVGNLAPSVEEHTLMVLFGKYGPVASVKTMWPRETEERPRGHTHTGFVAFMARQSAEDALQHLQGHLLHDHELRLGWGKAVPLPPVPVWPPAAGPPLVLAPGQAAPPPPVAPIHTREVAVRVPLSASRACLVDTLAAYVAVDGLAFEQAVMEREQSNPDFGFLFDPDCADHQYYRWRVYSLTQGDTLAQWRQEPFLIQQGGAVWHPPRRAEGPPSGLQAERQLTDEERDQLEGALRGLTMRRQSVAAAMVFAFDHAQAARDVADTLVEALTLSETPPSTKLARLYLLSDLLHNCTTSVPGAAAYRSHLLSAALPEVFESLHSACLALDSRISGLAMKQRVQAVLRTWPELFLFTELFLSGLEWSFHQPLAALPASEGLRTELLAMSADQLTMRCRRSGLVPGTEQQASVDRLLALDCFRRASRGESAPSAEAPPVPQFSQPNDRQAGGGWTTVTHAPAATAGVKRFRDDGRDVQ